MRPSLLLVLAAILAGCGGSGPSTDNTTAQADTTSAPAVVDWIGYYTGTLHMGNVPDIEMALWVRSDSTFVQQRRFADRDSIPHGSLGQWHVVQGLLTIGSGTDKLDFFRAMAQGLEMVDEMGLPFDTEVRHGLDKLADDIGDAIPRMRLTGTYTYIADSHNFQPCGSKFTWPCVMGMDTGEEEGEATIPTPHLEREYLKAVKQGGDPWVIEVVCTMGMGPAMEGDGADEYLFIHRTLKEGVTCP